MADLTPEALDELAGAARAADKPWHPWGDKGLPIREGAEAWAEDMGGYLGGEWGDLAGLCDPATVLALIDATRERDALAEKLAAVEALHTRDGSRCVEDQEFWPCGTVMALAGPSSAHTGDRP